MKDRLLIAFAVGVMMVAVKGVPYIVDANGVIETIVTTAQVIAAAGIVGFIAAVLGAFLYRYKDVSLLGFRHRR